MGLGCPSVLNHSSTSSPLRKSSEGRGKSSYLEMFVNEQGGGKGGRKGNVSIFSSLGQNPQASSQARSKNLEGKLVLSLFNFSTTENTSWASLW